MKMLNATEWLFFHLWKKNPKTDNCCPGIKIPKTIIYRWAQPSTYYESTEEATITRLEKEKIKPAKFLDYLNHHSPDACSLVYYTPKSSKSKVEVMNFDYIPKKYLQKFLIETDKTLNCIIQEFQRPKDDHNSRGKC